MCVCVRVEAALYWQHRAMKTEPEELVIKQLSSQHIDAAQGQNMHATECAINL